MRPAILVSFGPTAHFPRNPNLHPLLIRFSRNTPRQVSKRPKLQQVPCRPCCCTLSVNLPVCLLALACLRILSLSLFPLSVALSGVLSFATQCPSTTRRGSYTIERHESKVESRTSKNKNNKKKKKNKIKKDYIPQLETCLSRSDAVPPKKVGTKQEL